MKPAGTGQPAAGAGLLRRLLAMLYDSLLVLALIFVLSVPLVILNEGEAIAAETAWYRAYILVIAGGYFAGFWRHGGQTLGMKSWRIRLISMDGGAVDTRRALIRVAAALLSWLPAGAGYLWSLVDRDGLAWHDRLSGTRLIRWDPARSADA